MGSGLDLRHSRDQIPVCLAMEPLQEYRVTVCKVLEALLLLRLPLSMNGRQPPSAEAETPADPLPYSPIAAFDGV